MTYKPFLIAPFGTGLDTDVEPWLLPQDAFSNVVNGHIHHGVMEKREGFSKQGDIVHQDQTNWKITAVTKANPGVVTVTATTGLANSDTVEIRNVAGMTELNGNQYTVTGLTGTKFTLSGVNTTAFTTYTGTGDVYRIPENRVMGINQFVGSGNVKEVLAFDTKRAAKFNGTSLEYDPIDSANIFASGETDYVWTANWSSTLSTAATPLNRMYFTNGLAYSAGPPVINGIRYYTGSTTTTLFRPQINAGAYINGCKLIFAFRQRLLLLSTIEGATSYPQRARWCQAQGPSVSDGWDDNKAGKGGFVDAPTGDQIISARFVQDILIVYFTDSVWTLRATADPALPFRWDKINDFRACDAKMSVEQFDRYVVAAGIRGLTATDGVETRRFDERIEDFVGSAVNESAFKKIFSRRSFSTRRMWMLYPRVESDDADSALIYDEESSAFSKYDIAMNVLGYGAAAQDDALSDFGDKTLANEGDKTIGDYFFDKGSEVFLGGNRSGEIFVMEDGGDDNEFQFEAAIVGITAADPGVVTMTGSVGLSDGDLVTISSVAGMTEVNGREFTVASKSGNTFALKDEDTSAYTAYTSGGNARSQISNSISFELNSAAWNPWMTEGKQSQLGYIDLFMDTHQTTTLTAQFFTNNEQNPYVDTTINLLPNLTERASISGITRASPGQVTASSHGLTTGDIVYLYNVEGMSAANGGPYTITTVDGNNFTIGTDTTNFGIYTNGGVVTERPFSSTRAWKRIYAGGTGYQHSIKLTSEGKDRDLKIHAFMPWFRARSVRPI